MRTLLDRIDGLVEHDTPVASLAPVDRVELFNLQEEVNQILTAAADSSRMVCRRERRTGSNMPTNNCKTVEQRRMEAEGGRDMLRSLQHTEMPTGLR